MFDVPIWKTSLNKLDRFKSNETQNKIKYIGQLYLLKGKKQMLLSKFLFISISICRLQNIFLETKI
jgi:hypothetical protein